MSFNDSDLLNRDNSSVSAEYRRALWHSKVVLRHAVRALTETVHNTYTADYKGHDPKSLVSVPHTGFRSIFQYVY